MSYQGFGADVEVGTITVTPVNWLNVGGVCKPTNGAYLEKFKELQRQLNRIASVKGGTLIGVDGAIGTATLGLVRAAKIAAGGATDVVARQLATLDVSTCTAVAAQVDVITRSVVNIADLLKANKQVASPPPAKKPTIVNPTSGAEMPQGMTADLMDAYNQMSTVQKLAAVGILGGIGYFTWSGTKKKRRR